jgi:hypothetical protein
LDYEFPKPGMSDPVPKRSFITRIVTKVVASVTINS